MKRAKLEFLKKVNWLKQLIQISLQNRKIRKQIRRNLKTVKPFRTCRELPFRKYWYVIESGDFRHILDCKDLPEYYAAEVLQNTWDDLMEEYEALTGTSDYTATLRKANFRAKKKNDLNILQGAYLLMKMGNPESLVFLKAAGIVYADVSAKSLKALRSKIMAIKTRNQIEGAVRKETGGREDKKVTFEEVIADLEIASERNIDKALTLADYVAIVKAIDKKNKNLEKRYGRKN